ncbi:hypothetical protein [Planococcus lenghuensis]|uniref:hypothetical protein n=1 Tax=Planococcus lenghuensis TaxID=2213202 RepID=UPI0009845F98|nr:hypothetical protein [Planococcus lenghuensis]
MDKFDKAVSEKLKKFAEDQVEFTLADRDRVHSGIRQRKRKTQPPRPVFYWTALVAAVSLAIVLSLSFFGDQSQTVGMPVPEEPTGEIYDGSRLHIGVIGDMPAWSFSDVGFRSVTSDELRDNPKQYDAFFISAGYFDELSRNEWTEVFRNVETPVFFLNLDSAPEVFFTDGTDYGEAISEAVGNTVGFVTAGGESGDIEQSWAYGNPTPSTDPNDVPEPVYHAIFHDIEDYMLAYTDCCSLLPLIVYEGTPLTIGVVGGQPDVQNEHVTFRDLTLDNVRAEEFEGLDAVVIMEPALPEAAKPEFAAVYEDSPIPFFFADSETIIYAFLDEQVDYGETLETEPGEYLMGAFNGTTISLGLYNDIKSKETIASAYNRLFKIIETAKETGNFK